MNYVGIDHHRQDSHMTLMDQEGQVLRSGRVPNLLAEIEKFIERKNPPPGWALPGGFVDYGESLEDAALREAREETSLDVVLVSQFHTYSDPARDPRGHTITTVYIARARGRPRARDDARNIGIFGPEEIPARLAFDHAGIIEDYYREKRGASHGSRQRKKRV